MGYRCHEVALAEPDKCDHSTRIKQVRESKHSTARPIVKVVVGFNLLGCSRPHVDPSHALTLAKGAVKRFCNLRRPLCEDRLTAIEAFTWRWCEQNLRLADPGSDVSFDGWLQRCPYPAWRKQELLQCWEEAGRRMHPDYEKISSFVKDESYDTYKHARWINSRSDQFKCWAGPWIQVISDVVFGHPDFIKKIPMAERADYVVNHLRHCRGSVWANDYSALEASYLREISFAISFVVYKYVMQAVPGFRPWFSEYVRIVTGLQQCKNRYLKVSVMAKLMSGEMDTSLRNGLTNKLVLEFIAHLIGAVVRSVIEGDDSLFNFDTDVLINRAYYEALGFDVKLEQYDSIPDASFCGLTFDATDRAVITDPRKVLSETGEASARYANAGPVLKRELLRAKGFSLCHQYPGAPVLQEMGLTILRLTEKVSMSSFLERRIHYRGSYEHERIANILASTGVPYKEVGQGTRLLMESKFGVTVQQQFHVENYLRSLSGDILDIHFDPWLLDLDFPSEWYEYARVYGVNRYDNGFELEPLMALPQKDFNEQEFFAMHAPEDVKKRNWKFNLDGPSFSGNVQIGEQIVLDAGRNFKG